ncbi:hypothetical protein TNCV_982071 [Trichonephila clavipes]|nr:hypothetical protein TNCV_982071 [Trichonephila clavipes]
MFNFGEYPPPTQMILSLLYLTVKLHDKTRDGLRHRQTGPGPMDSPSAGASLRSRRCLNKILIWIILKFKHYSCTYSPKNKEFQTACQLTTVSSGAKSQDLGGQFTGPKREIRRSPNVCFNKSIVARAGDMLHRLVGTTAPGHHDCSIQE